MPVKTDMTDLRILLAVCLKDALQSVICLTTTTTTTTSLIATFYEGTEKHIYGKFSLRTETWLFYETR